MYNNKVGFFFKNVMIGWGSVIIWGAIKLNYWGTGRERQWLTKNAAKNVNMRSSFLYYLIISLFLFKILSTGLFLFFSQDSFLMVGDDTTKKNQLFFFFLTKVIGVLSFYPQIS